MIRLPRRGLAINQPPLRLRLPAQAARAASPAHRKCVWWRDTIIRVSDRMPVILAPSPGRGSARSPTRGDLMRPFPANLMRMWPISTSVNKSENDDSSIVEPILGQL